MHNFKTSETMMPTIISDAAKQSGVSAKMIRYYESIKLLPTVGRTKGNYRTYSENDIHTLHFIRRTRDLGYSISDIKHLLSLWRDQHRASADVKRIALDHAVSLRHKIAEMEAMLRAVEHLAAHCHGDHRPDCPIMDDLSVGLTTPARGPGTSARRGTHSRNTSQKGVHL